LSDEDDDQQAESSGPRVMGGIQQSLLTDGQLAVGDKLFAPLGKMIHYMLPPF
jgi:hypothetical protein